MGCGSSAAEDSAPKANSQPAETKVTQPAQKSVDSKVEDKKTDIPQGNANFTQPEDANTENAPNPDSKDSAPVKARVGRNEDEAFGLLLCGAGESGKTTFTRQLKKHYLGGFSNEERESFKGTIRGNLIESMQHLMTWAERNGLDYDDLDSVAELIREKDPFNTEYTFEVADQLSELWRCDAIQDAFSHRDETIIPDHMDYFFAKAAEIADENYSPSDEDILKARIRSIGIEKITLNINGANTRLFDVGGQKTERAKWDKCYDDVEGCIFCISLAEFDKPLYEQTNETRMTDALALFADIIKKPKFLNAPIFILANKYDFFSEKIKNTDKFISFYPDFKGDSHDPEACSQYLIQKFLDCARPPRKTQPIKVYKIVALNSDDVINTTSDFCKFITENYFEA